jgi:hypothetical protein
MATGDIGSIRAALATVLEAITDLRVYDKVPDIVHLPAAVIEPDSADFEVAMGKGTDTYQFKVLLLAQRAVIRQGQTDLDALCSGAGARSVRATVFADRTLGGTVGHAHVAGFENYGGVREDATVDHIAAEARVVIHTTGTA